MMGLPGAGKTTAAEIIEELTGAVRLSSDEARLMLWPEPEFNEEEHQALYEYLDEQTEKLLKSGKSVVYDANLNRYEHRQEKYQLAHELGIEVMLCWVQTPREVARNRRIEEMAHHHLVAPGETAAQMFDRVALLIEEPSENEPFTVLDGTKLNHEYIKNALEL